MSPRAASSTSTKPAPWVGKRRLLVVADGPLAGRWYFVEDWQQLVASAERMAEHRDRQLPPNPVLDYVVDERPGRLVDHPREPAAGRPLHYAPHRRHATGTDSAIT